MQNQTIDIDILYQSAYPSSPAATADLVRMLLRRLKRLYNIQTRCSELLNTEGMYLINRAIYSTYSDCRALGIGEEANTILGRSIKIGIEDISVGGG